MKVNFLLIFAFIAGFNNSVMSQTSIDSLEQVALSSDDTLKIKIYGDICWDLKFSAPSKSISFGKKAIAISQKIASTSQEAQGHSDLGMVYYLTGQYAPAGFHYDSARVLYQMLKDTTGIAKIFGRQGAIHQKLGRMDKALEQFLQALKLSQKIGFDQLASYDMNNVAIVYMDQTQYEKSLEYFFKSLEIKERLNDRYQISGTLMNIGAAYQYMGQFDKALDYFERSINMCREVEQMEYLSAALNNYGGLLLEMKQPNRAKPYLIEGVEIRRASKDLRGLTSSLVNLGRVHSFQFEFLSAKKLLDEALQIAKELDAKDAIQKAYQALAELYSNQGKYKQAFKYHELFTIARDSFLNEENTRQLAEMRTRFETEEKEQQIKELNQDKILQASLLETKDLQIQRNNLIILALVILLLAALIIAYLYFNRRQLRQKANFEFEKSKLKGEQLRAVIHSQEDERKRFAMDLHDDFGQLITALRINLNQTQVPSTSRNTQANLLLDNMYTSLKNIAFNLMPQTLIEKGLNEALDELCQQLDNLSATNFTLRTFGMDGIDLSNMHKVAIYRIVQEVINNIIKYSMAQKVDLNLTGHENGLSIVIEDDGKGFDINTLSQGTGNGWRNISSRLDLIEGEIEYDTTPGRKNTTVTISIPYLQVSKKAA